MGGAYFQDISNATWLSTIFLRTFPIGIFLLLVHPVYVVILEFFLEYVDGMGSLCIDHVSNEVYDRFDKLFDSINIIFFILWMIYAMERRTQNKNDYRRYYWVPWVLALALFRLLGMIIFYILDDNVVFAIFINVWLPLFFFFALLDFWYVSVDFKNKYPCIFYTLVILIFAYKIVEENLHHNQELDYIEESCGMFSTQFTHSDALQMGRMIIPAFLILIVIAIQSACLGCTQDNRWRLKS